jgi:hypothetical protein
METVSKNAMAKTASFKLWFYMVEFGKNDKSMNRISSSRAYRQVKNYSDTDYSSKTSRQRRVET